MKHFATHIFTTCLLMAMAFTAQAQSRTIIWRYPTDTGQGPTGVGYTTTKLARGTGLSRSSATNGLNSSGFPAANSVSLGNNKCYTFSITPAPGTQLDITAVSARLQRSNSGPTNAQISLQIGTGTEQLIGSVITVPTSFRLFTANASLTRIRSRVTVRVYGWNAGTTAGTMRIDSGMIQAVLSDTTPCVPPASPTISATRDTIRCGRDSVLLTSSSPRNNLWSTGDTSVSIWARRAGDFSVQVGRGNCFSEPSPLFTLRPSRSIATPTITRQGDTALCGNQSLTLTSSLSAGRYLWSNGDTSRSTIISQAGRYTVQYLVNGCLSAPSAPVTVTRSQGPEIPNISVVGSTSICPGQSVILRSSALSNNLWSNGATTREIIVERGGYYSVSAGVGLCRSVASDSVLVTVISEANRPRFAENGLDTISFELYGGNGTTNPSYVSTNANRTYTADDAALYSSSVDFGYDFSSTSFATIFSPDDAPGTLNLSAWPVRNRTIFRQGNVAIPVSFRRATQLDSMWESSNLIPEGSFGANRAGSRAGFLLRDETRMFRTADGRTGLIVMNLVLPGSNGNAYTRFTVITAKRNKIQVTGNLGFCEGFPPTLSAPYAGRYIWSNGDTSRVIVPRTPGIYYLTVVSANASGCVSPRSDSVTVSVLPRPSRPVITATGDSLDAGINGRRFIWMKDSVPLLAATRRVRNVGTGTYTVYVVSDNNCASDTSAPFILTSVIGRTSTARAITAFPNPSSHGWQIKGLVANSPWQVTNTLGQVVMEGRADTDTIQLLPNATLPKGLYYLRQSGSIVKLIKQ